ncbi:MAG: hypothetical protein PHN45_04330 [Methylococcales bacterium]|nr:hypothetical protein [Methylococcales bacterium]MDD5753962.1 hypothetical protein [Methylococcales bacterium]
MINFTEPPETKKPPHKLTNGGFRILVESAPCIGLQADNTLISTPTRCENSTISSVHYARILPKFQK